MSLQSAAILSLEGDHRLWYCLSISRVNLITLSQTHLFMAIFFGHRVNVLRCYCLERLVPEMIYHLLYVES